MHGYALVKHIKEVSDNLLQVEEGSLCPALQRMLREGWLESEAGTSAKGRPARIYRLTDGGLRHLEKEVVSFEKMFTGIPKRSHSSCRVSKWVRPATNPTRRRRNAMDRHTASR